MESKIDKILLRIEKRKQKEIEIKKNKENEKNKSVKKLLSSISDKERHKKYYQLNKEIIKQKRKDAYGRFKQKHGCSDYTVRRKRELEKYKEQERIKREKRRKERGDEFNAKAREVYRNDPNGAAKERNRRHKREPYRAVRAAVRDFQKGILGIDECLDRVDKALAHIDEAIAKRTGLRSKDSGYLQCGTGQTQHEYDSEIDSDKD